MFDYKFFSSGEYPDLITCFAVNSEKYTKEEALELCKSKNGKLFQLEYIRLPLIDDFQLKNIRMSEVEYKSKYVIEDDRVFMRYLNDLKIPCWTIDYRDLSQCNKNLIFVGFDSIAEGVFA